MKRPSALISRAIAVALTAALAGPQAGAECPSPAAPLAEEPAAQSTAGEAPSRIEFEADGLEGQREGQMLLKGEVVISQGRRRLKTRDAVYDQRSQSLKLDHPVEYSDPDLKVSGSAAQVEPAGGASFEHAQFELPSRNARGSARRIQATARGRN